jgi:hypothetical protein
MTQNRVWYLLVGCVLGIAAYIMWDAGSRAPAATPTARSTSFVQWVATRIELTPARLEIPVGDSREAHIEVFTHDTPLVLTRIDIQIVTGADVAELRRYHAPFVTIRGLQPGDATLQVSIGELSARLPITVVGGTPE